MIWPSSASHASSAAHDAIKRRRRQGIRRTVSYHIPHVVKVPTRFRWFSRNFLMESRMTFKRMMLSALSVFCLVAPLAAQSGWTEEYLMRFNPAASRTAAAPPLNPVVGQLLQTGTVPISIQEVVNMMLDNNLDIRSNRFSPRSTALQTLVF